MKRKLFCFFFVLCALAGLVPANAEEGFPSSDELVLSLITAAGCADESEWMEEELLPFVGNGGEDYAYALLGMGKTELLFSYGSKAKGMLASEESYLSDTTRNNLSLLLFLSGAVSSEAPIEGKGVMSDIYALLLSACGVWNDPEAESGLTAQQLPDGGWSLRGETSDPDVTALALRALALAGKKQEDPCVAQALAYLAKAQLPDGTFFSYGVSNCESTAQVLISLCTLGIDPDTDPRFTKERSLSEAMFSFWQGTGFSHVAGGGVSVIATGQGFLAAVCRERFLTGRSSLWENRVSPPASSAFPSVVPPSSAEKTELSYRLPMSFVLLGAMALAILLLALTKRLSRGNVLALLLCGVLLLGLLWLVEFRSTEDYYSSDPEGTPVGEVYLSIRCDALVSLGVFSDASDGGILEKTPIELMEGDTVYDVLVRASKKHRLRLEIRGNGALCYIRGIEELKELQYGELSGWMFFVNGEEASVGCAEHILNDGDFVEWKYTLSMGKDL